jgi:hypothetical protein
MQHMQRRGQFPTFHFQGGGKLDEEALYLQIKTKVNRKAFESTRKAFKITKKALEITPQTKSRGKHLSHRA